MLRRLMFASLLVALGTPAPGATHDLRKATGLFTPSFRGAAMHTTWTGWQTFGVGGFGTPIVNQPSDLGDDPGTWQTTNGEDHTPFSSNFYSFTGAVAEDLTLPTDGTVGAGFTTVIVQALALAFGGSGEFPRELLFADIGGLAPTEVLQTTNANGIGQVWAKYELPGNEPSLTVSISTALDNSHVAIDRLTVDTLWSPTGYAPDTAIASPEPLAATLTLLGLGGLLASRGLFKTHQ
ncbi:MAG: hypothetical protein KDA37_03705 [Planctomycetales bacterium]|nr:hypothetical protein [Planctomycetales bacterium]